METSMKCINFQWKCNNAIAHKNGHTTQTKAEGSFLNTNTHTRTPHKYKIHIFKIHKTIKAKMKNKTMQIEDTCNKKG